jgi:hypothetical protein
MVGWNPASREYVERLLATQLIGLSPAQRARWHQIAVPLRPVPIANEPGESVFVAAEFRGQVIYFEDVEEGWNAAPIDLAGGIASRGSEQDELAHTMFRLFGVDGPPDQMPPNKSLERTREG